jgi:RNA polymerase sigma-70 factor (ECF subfamily)
MVQTLQVPSFEWVYRRHVAFVRRILRGMGITSHVDDATQDVFLVVHHRLREFDGRHPVTTWLYEIARRVAGHYRRALSRALTLVPIDDALIDRTASSLDLALLIERRRTIQSVQAMLEELGPERSQLIALADIAGCSAPEIAAMTGARLSTVYTRLRRARAALQLSQAWCELER